MPFFTYDQNNSGGFFCEPAHHVIVEADDAEQADRIAEEHGVYFDGCMTGNDCSCCGDRWTSQHYGFEDSSDEPQIYGEDPKSRVPVCRDEALPVYILVRKDGSVEGAV